MRGILEYQNILNDANCNIKLNYAIGSGGFATVFDIGDGYVLKIVDKDNFLENVKKEDPSVFENFDIEILDKFNRELDINKKLMAKKIKCKNLLVGEKLFDNFEFNENLFAIKMKKMLGSFSNVWTVTTFSEELAISLAIDICKALIVLNSYGVIHRDIKPDNILIDKDKDGKVFFVLGDFGIGKVISTSKNETRNSHIFTTKEYASPEFYTEKSVDTRHDIFMLGVVLYKYCNNGNSRYIQSQEPKAPPVNASEKFQKIILKMVEFNRNDRYQTPTEVLQDLENLQSEIEQKNNELKQLPAKFYQLNMNYKSLQGTLKRAKNDLVLQQNEIKTLKEKITIKNEQIVQLQKQNKVKVNKNANLKNDKFSINKINEFFKKNVWNIVTVIITALIMFAILCGTIKTDDGYNHIWNKYTGVGSIWTIDGTYNGEFVEGKRTGEGILMYYNNDVYVGEFVNGELTGEGRLTKKNGVYTGNFVNGLITGEGTLVKANNDVYEGNFEKSEIKGQGKYTFADGDVYEGNFEKGDFEKGNFTGKGKYTWADGDVYEGDFLNGSITGKGKYTWATGAVYEGDFFDRARTGDGKIIMTNGDVYEGGFFKGDFTGKGVYTWASGAIYVGDFLNGERTGQGKLTTSDGKVYEGEFKDGKFVEE